MDFKKIATAKDLKLYLNAPLANSSWTHAYHYTNLHTLFCIFKNATLKFSSMKKMNDVFELKFTEGCKDFFFCLTKGWRTEYENFGMWAMYGHIKDQINVNEDLETQSKHIGVKIEFSKDIIENFLQANPNISSQLVAYADLMFKKNKNITVGKGINRNKIDIIKDKDFYGCLKDTSWSYESELRFRLKYETLTEQEKNDGEAFRPIDLQLLKKLKIYPSPLFSVETCERILKDLFNSDDLHGITFYNSAYKDLYK